MKTYCFSYKKYTGNKNSNVRKTKQNRLMLLSNSAVFGKTKSAFVKNKVSTILINLKWIKSLTNFYWLATYICQNCI